MYYVCEYATQVFNRLRQGYVKSLKNQKKEVQIKSLFLVAKLAI